MSALNSFARRNSVGLCLQSLISGHRRNVVLFTPSDAVSYCPESFQVFQHKHFDRSSWLKWCVCQIIKLSWNCHQAFLTHKNKKQVPTVERLHAFSIRWSSSQLLSTTFMEIVDKWVVRFSMRKTDWKGQMALLLAWRVLSPCCWHICPKLSCYH